MTHEPHLFENFPFLLESKKRIIHYSCNSPSIDVLKKYGIEALGENFDSDPTEIISIPYFLYEKRGYSFKNCDAQVLKINCEHLVRDLDKLSKKNKNLNKN